MHRLKLDLCLKVFDGNCTVFGVSKDGRPELNHLVFSENQRRLGFRKEVSWREASVPLVQAPTVVMSDVRSLLSLVSRC